MSKSRQHNELPQTSETFEKAIELRNLGDLKEAKRLLAELVNQNPDKPAIRWILGGIYLDEDHYTEATEQFSTLIRMEPKSERASLGLFHSLWGAGRHSQAFDEMRRFLTRSKSEEYRRILREATRKDESEKQ